MVLVKQCKTKLNCSFSFSLGICFHTSEFIKTTPTFLQSLHQVLIYLTIPQYKLRLKTGGPTAQKISETIFGSLMKISALFQIKSVKLEFL